MFPATQRMIHTHDSFFAADRSQKYFIKSPLFTLVSFFSQLLSNISNIKMTRSRNTAELYKRYLCAFMAWKDGLVEQPYPTSVEFTQEQLLSITPTDIKRYFQLKAYGMEEPGPNDNPTECRSSTLQQIKKALSFFMPNQQAWVVEMAVGNPTKSKEVNQVITSVKRAEVRKLGKSSNAKRDLRMAEYRKTLELLKDSPSNVNYFDCASRLTAMMKLQFHIIARTDDICNLETADLKSHDRFPSTCLQLKVSWSKNVMEERQCPDQILIGSEDSAFCIIVSLACFLESTITSGAQDKYLFAEESDSRAPDRLNSRYYRILNTVWKKPEFQEIARLTRGSIGTHSLRKFPSTWVVENGGTDVEVEIRGRWKGQRNGRTVNRYISPEQLPTDAKVASILCVGGPVRYKVKSDSHVTSLFMQEVVVPGIYNLYSSEESNQIASVLAPALLWAAHSEDLSHLMSEQVRKRIVDGYALIRGQHPADYNPVEKVPLHVFRVQNQVQIEELVRNEHDGARAHHQIPAGATADSNTEALRTLQIQLHRLQQDVAQARQAHEVSKKTVTVVLDF
jgi:hypothetical protein